MDEQTTRATESARHSQDAAARRHAPTAGARETARVAGLGSETLTVWVDAAQRALRDVAELSAQATQEGARQLTAWQQTHLDLMREAQNLAFRWSAVWPEFVRDPVRGYQRSFEEGLEAAQRVFELTRRNAEAMTHSCQRLERAAADTSRTLGETFRDASTRMQDVYARAERVRAA
jgi:hypothetical protein